MSNILYNNQVNIHFIIGMIRFRSLLLSFLLICREWHCYCGAYKHIISIIWLDDIFFTHYWLSDISYLQYFACLCHMKQQLLANCQEAAAEASNRYWFQEQLNCVFLNRNHKVIVYLSLMKQPSSYPTNVYLHIISYDKAVLSTVCVF